MVRACGSVARVPTHGPGPWARAVAALVLAGLAACLCPDDGSGAERPERPKAPNIVLILADDMGWMDSGIYGSRYYDTPNIDRLARRGMLFTDAYAANPLCSPTRASILTGTYPARLRITTPAGHLPPLPDEPLLPATGPPRRKMLLPRSRRFLAPEETTIAEALHRAGYRTGHVGKWHLGLRPEHWPERQGFDVSFHGAPDPGPRSYFSPYRFRAGTVTDGPPGEYITDRLTDEAIRFIEANRGRPFYLSLWHYAVHGPWGHKEEITRKYAGKKDPRAKQNNPIMASMLASLDESVGRVLDKLDELKLADHTVVIFFSDNGGNTHSRIGPEGLPPTNNAPLRGGKATIYEGGTREPMIVCWPGVVRPGSRCSEVVSSVDFYPTILQIAGLAPERGQVLDGESLLPLLEQTGKLRRDAIFCHFPHGLGKLNAPSTYVRRGDWKLIRFYETNESFPNRFELYHLKDDLGETNNLAGRMPEKVKELDALIDGFLERTDALVPVPNPDFDPQVAALAGWVNRACDASVRDGVLRVQCKGPRSFLGVAGFKHPGPLVLQFRARTTVAGRGQVHWRTAGQKKFPEGQRVSFDPKPDGRWHDAEVKLPVQGTLIHLRFFPAGGAGTVEIDRIRLSGADGTSVRTWEFGGPAK